MRIKAGLKKLTLLVLTVFALTLGSEALVQDTFAASNGGAAVSAGQVRIQLGQRRYHHRRYYRWHRYHRGHDRDDRPYRP
jgi:hypothetical protein